LIEIEEKDTETNEWFTSDFTNWEQELWVRKYQPMDNDIFKSADKFLSELKELKGMLDAIDIQKEDKANCPYWTIIGNVEDTDYELHQTPDQVRASQDAKKQEHNIRKRITQIHSELDLLGDKRLEIRDDHENEIKDLKNELKELD